MYRCHSCNRLIDAPDKPGRSDTCPECEADLHCCLNCTFYDSRVYNECRESQAERVVMKERSNFCDYFRWSGNDDRCTIRMSPRPKIQPKTARVVEPARPPKKGKRVNPLDTLFKKKP
jgi:hypothetical protein